MKKTLNPTLDPFLAVVDAFLKATGMGEATLSMHLFNHGKRLAQIRAGDNDPRASTLNRAYAWLSRAWPDHLGVEWPECIVSRPSRVVSFKSGYGRKAPTRLSA